MMIWFEFILCAGLLTYFAYNLCKEGIIISKKTRLAEGLIGMLFLAIATSFPEIVTAASAVSMLGKVGLGYGDIVGSVITNLMILMALDFYHGKGRILFKLSRLNKLTGFFALIVVLVVSAAAVLRLFPLIRLPFFRGVGLESLIVVCIYFVCMAKVQQKGKEEPEEEIYHVKDEPFWEIWTKFILFMVVVMFLSVWMAKIGEKIVVDIGLSQTFTGTLLLGFTTSLPEIIVSFTALRVASVNMAVGNILGSNLFDVCIIPFLDVLTKKPILGMLTIGQLIATLLVLVLSIITVAGLHLKRDSTRRIGWDTGSIFVIGFIGFVILYFIR